MGIPEYIAIAIIIIVSWSCMVVINAIVMRRIFRINEIIERLNRLIKVTESGDKWWTETEPRMKKQKKSFQG